MGPLVWMAEPFFDEFPTIEQTKTISVWRWPVFFPLGAALHRKIVDRIGRIAIPDQLLRFPRLRAGGGRQPWRAYEDGQLDGLGPVTEDRSLPISMIVNDTLLKEMLVSDWRPVDRW